MAADTQTLERIKQLNATAAALSDYFAKHKATVANPKVDKHGAAFEGRTDRFAVFDVNATFCCHTGTYGSSSCGKDLYAPTDSVQPYFIRAMAKHQEALFETAASLMREDAAKLTDKARAELAALAAMVDGLSVSA